MIISASRRTDIPAFYAPWFFNRLQEGYLLVPNPFDPRTLSRISLGRDVVDCIVFWTKNPAPMLPRLGELSGYNYYFQYTLNPYGAATVLVGGVSGLTKVLKELHIKGIPTVRNLKVAIIFVMTKADRKTAHLIITNGNHGIFQQIRQKVGKVFPGNDIFRHFYNIACDMQGKVDILCQGTLLHIGKKRI
jgi:hypothetical protein